MNHRHSIERLADCAPVPHPDSWPARPPPSSRWDSPAHKAAYAAIRKQAERTARAMIKARARAYVMRPSELDALCPAISRLAPFLLIATIKEIERLLKPCRHFGFGGEIEAINLRGALWYARYARAIASRKARSDRFHDDGQFGVGA